MLRFLHCESVMKVFCLLLLLTLVSVVSGVVITLAVVAGLSRFKSVGCRCCCCCCRWLSWPRWFQRLLIVDYTFARLIAWWFAELFVLVSLIARWLLTGGHRWLWWFVCFVFVWQWNYIGCIWAWRTLTACVTM